jgi:hypothetical protein
VRPPRRALPVAFSGVSDAVETSSDTPMTTHHLFWKLGLVDIEVDVQLFHAIAGHVDPQVEPYDVLIMVRGRR